MKLAQYWFDFVESPAFLRTKIAHLHAFFDLRRTALHPNDQRVMNGIAAKMQIRRRT